MAEGGGQTERDPSGWTVDTLKAHLDEKIMAVQKRVDEQVDRIDERHATEVGETAARFRQVNEFRGALDDLGKTMATRRELESATVSGNLRVDELTKAVADLRSRIDIGPSGLQALQAGAAVQQGRQEGVKLTTGTLFAAVAAFATIVGLFLLGAGALDEPAPADPPITVTVPTP